MRYFWLQKGKKKSRTTNFYHQQIFITHQFCCCCWIRVPGSEIRNPRTGIRDPRPEIRHPGSGMDKSQDPGSEINIPDPQHCLSDPDLGSESTYCNQLNPDPKHHPSASGNQSALVPTGLLKSIRWKYLSLLRIRIRGPGLFWPLDPDPGYFFEEINNSFFWVNNRVADLDPDSVGSVDPDPDPGGQKWPAKAVLRIRIRDPVLFWPLDPGSGIGFFRISDPGSLIPDLGSQTHIFKSLLTIF